MGCEVNDCCFCIELRTGSLVIGYLGLVGNIILTLMSIVGLTMGGVIVAEGKDEQTQTAGAIIVVVLCIVLAVVIANLIFNIVLLVGLHKYKRGCVKAYLIFTGIFIVISIIFIIVNVSTTAPASNIVRDVISTLFSIYFFIVIRSYYLKMDDVAKRPAIYNTA